jgi:uncharacterized membrane protein (DUF106 family)
VNETDLGLWALFGIVVASFVSAAIAILVIRRWSDQDALARTKSRAQAHLLELRLFIDDPAQILRSQRALIADQARIIKLLLPSFLILMIPMAVVLWTLDAFYSRGPLRVGEPVVVSTSSRQVGLNPPSGLLVETKPLFVQATGETCWRVRAIQPLRGTLRIADRSAAIVAGAGVSYLPEPLWRESIRLPYPRATVVGLHWLIWFLLLSAVFALVLRRSLRVVF